MKKLVVLVILDGFGYRKDKAYNAISQAKTPTLDFFYQHFPHTLLAASGPAVGLPPGCSGNSEAGHTTLGAGHIILQPVTLLDHAIDGNSFFHNTVLHKTITQLPTDKKLHIIGLASDAGIHSMTRHIITCVQIAHNHNIHSVFVHALLDGRDSPPRSASVFLTHLNSALRTIKTGILGSVCGRFYGMDRDKNWERTQAYYRMLTTRADPPFCSWKHVLDYYYPHQITDEFIPPTLLNPHAVIEPHDGIIFINVRPDRARQLTTCFLGSPTLPFKTKNISLTFFITPFSYGTDLQTTELYPQEPINKTLKEILNEQNKTVFSIAETEKYAHITYFFDGGREEPFSHETRVLIPSLREKTYERNPEMSADKITDAVMKSLQENPRDFYLINYANADMVGHSGNMQQHAKQSNASMNN